MHAHQSDVYLVRKKLFTVTCMYVSIHFICAHFNPSTKYGLHSLLASFHCRGLYTPNGDVCSSRWPKTISSQWKEVSSLTSAVEVACLLGGLPKVEITSLSLLSTTQRICSVNLTSSSDKMLHWEHREPWRRPIPIVVEVLHFFHVADISKCFPCEGNWIFNCF